MAKLIQKMIDCQFKILSYSIFIADFCLDNKYHWDKKKLLSYTSENYLHTKFND